MKCKYCKKKIQGKNKKCTTEVVLIPGKKINEKGRTLPIGVFTFATKLFPCCRKCKTKTKKNDVGSKRDILFAHRPNATYRDSGFYPNIKKEE